MISRKFIIAALVVLGIIYFGFNSYLKPADNQVITENQKVSETFGTVGRG